MVNLEVVKNSPDGMRYLDINLIDEFKENPRHEHDTVYERSSDFRRLFGSIKTDGIKEPLRVYAEVIDGVTRFQLIAGHRRLAVAKQLGLADVPVQIDRPPETLFDRMTAMWNAEELKEDWPEYKRFDFFRKTVQQANKEKLKLATDVKALATKLSMKQSTVRTYLSFLEIETIANLMSDESADVIKHAGRHKTLRAMTRAVGDFIKERPEVVQNVTAIEFLSKSDDKKEAAIKVAKNELAKRLLAKYEFYGSEKAGLGVGPGVALERTVPIIALKHHTALRDERFEEWLTQPEDVLAREVIAVKQTTSAIPNERAGEFGTLLQTIIKPRPGTMSFEDMDTYERELIEAGQMITDALTKVRISRTKKTKSF